MTTQNKGLSAKAGVVIGVSAAAMVALAAYAGAQGAIQIPGVDAASQAKLQTTPARFQPPSGAPVSFADIFERVSPAVVSIQVEVERPASQGVEIPGFPGFQLVPPEGQEGPPRRAQAEGSGFFISADGYIVTNNHVVEDADEIKVVLKDERELVATVVGLDPDTDLAVLKVEGRNFPFVNFENAATPRVGDWVIAIGNPFGLGGTATVGIISAEGRRTPDRSSTFVDFLQIDAAINSGNSGGPTFDVYGRVIGVNSQILSPSGGSVGIGFAIPAEIADSVTKQLISEGSVTRGYLGAEVLPYTRDIAEGMGHEFVEGRGGALIARVSPGDPADRAGVQDGDVVLQLNGQAIKDQTDLTRAVAATRAGDTLRLQIMRDGRTMNINVRSGTRPSVARLEGDEEGAPSPGRGGGRGARPPAVEEPVKLPTALGMSLGPIDEAARRRYSLDEGVAGALVADLERTAEAAAQGVRPGDVILQAGGRRVTGPNQVLEAVASQRRAGRDSILLLVRQRDGRQRPFLLEIGEETAPVKQG